MYRYKMRVIYYMEVLGGWHSSHIYHRNYIYYVRIYNDNIISVQCRTVAAEMVPMTMQYYYYNSNNIYKGCQCYIAI